MDGGEETARRRGAFAVLGAFALLLLGQGVAREARLDRRRTPDRYAALVAALPADAVELGYVSNEPAGDVSAQLLFETQYALAPRVVAAGRDARYTVANLTDAGSLQEVCARATSGRCRSSGAGSRSSSARVPVSPAAGLLALAAIVAPGVGLVEHAFASRPASRSERALRAALALGLGAGVWSLGFSVAVFALGLSSPVVAGKDVVLVLFGALLFASARRRRTSEARGTRAPALEPAPGSGAPIVPIAEGERASSLLATLVTLASVLAALLVLERFLAHPEGSWDALAIWNNRARFLLLGEGRAFTRAFDPANAHPDYPLLVPACVAQGWRWLGESPGVALGVGAGFLAVAVASLALVVARRRGAEAGAGVALALLGAPSFVTLGAAQIADVPLAAFLAIALGLVALSLEEDERRRERLALAGLAAGLGAWTKNEGELFLVALGLALALTRTRSDEPRRAALERVAIFGLGSLAPILVLAWLKLALAPRNDILAGLGGAVGKLADLLRPLTIGRSVAEEAVRAHRWGLGVLASPLLLVAFRKSDARGPAARVAAIVAGVATAGFLAVYLVTPLDLAWHLDHSLERLVAQLLPPWLLFVFLSLPGAKPGDLR